MATAAGIGSMVDANAHLWDQAANPVFWLSDRMMAVDMLGDYSSLPDRFTVDDYLRATAPFDVSGIIWSDPGTADPSDAIDWLRRQDAHGLVAGIVTLGDPLAPGFAGFVQRVAEDELVTSVRVRLVKALRTGSSTDRHAATAGLVDGLRVVAQAGLVVTIEASAADLPQITALADELGDARVVVDHFGWPDDLSPLGRQRHFELLRPLAEHATVATRLDALGTIFGAWNVDTVRPWLEGVVDIFGCDRCMVGSDMPIETLRTSFADLCRAYDEIFRARSEHERRQLFRETALRWLGARADGSPSTHG